VQDITVIIQDQELRQDIGLAESGRMKINEIHNMPTEEMPYDVPADIHFHMLNDDGFYRKYYMPCMDKIRSERNEKVIQGHLKPMIDRCINHYCLKYDIPMSPKELMPPQDREELASKVLDFDRNPKEELDAPASADRIS